MKLDSSKALVKLDDKVVSQKPQEKKKMNGTIRKVDVELPLDAEEYEQLRSLPEDTQRGIVGEAVSGLLAPQVLPFTAVGIIEDGQSHKLVATLFVVEVTEPKQESNEGEPERRDG